MKKSSNAEFGMPVMGILNAYRETYGAVLFDEEKMTVVFGGGNARTISDMTDHEVIQVALLDLVARENETFEAMKKNLAQIEKLEGNRAQRRSKK